MKRNLLILVTLATVIILVLHAPRAAHANDADQLITVDHYVAVHSTVPAIVGQLTEIYVRERLRPGLVLRATSLAGRVVLFINGAGTPAEVPSTCPSRTTVGWPISPTPASMCSPWT